MRIGGQSPILISAYARIYKLKLVKNDRLKIFAATGKIFLFNLLKLTKILVK